MSDQTPTDEAELRVWAEAHAQFGSVQARQVLALLDRLADSRRQFSAGMLWSAEQIERYAGCVRSNMEAHGEAAEFGGVVPALEELAQMIRNSASGVRD